MATTEHSLYTPDNLNPAYQLRYGWTGWPSTGSVPSLPHAPFLEELSRQWEGDTLRLLEHEWTSEKISMTFSARPAISPVFLATRVKGRLQHALRLAGQAIQFSRKLAVRSIGSNTRETVEAYIRKQVDRDRPADPRYEAMLRSQAIDDSSVDLSQPSETGSGRYWYNLHLVLVVAGRYRMGWGREGKDVAGSSREVAQKNGYGI